MSTTPNAFGNFLSNQPPFISNYAGIGGPNGTVIKPGGRVAAYVRSTGAQDGDDQFAATGNLVTTINEGLKRCRSGFNDIVYVLPGHTETYSSTGAIWANLVAGAQIIGAGNAGCTNAPNLTLAHTGASMALNVANVTVAGLNINTATASTTGFIVITGAGVTFANNFVNVTAALGANPAIAVTGAANLKFVGNVVVGDCTDPIIEVTGAGTTNMVIAGNLLRQSQGTSGGDYINVADAAISGFIVNNFCKTATDEAAPADGIVIGTAAQANTLQALNYVSDLGAAAAAGVLADGT